MTFSDELMGHYSLTGQNWGNFYTGMSDVIDVLLVNQLNDEISASLDNRGPLVEILKKSIIQCPSGVEQYHEVAARDLQRVMSSATDFLTGSQFLDFSVSSFSVFESWVSKIYYHLKLDANREAERRRKVEKLVNQHHIAPIEQRAKIQDKILQIGGSFIPGMEKIEKVLSVTKARDASAESADHQKTIKFASALRNSIHNLGIIKASEATSLKGIDISPNKPSYAQNHSDRLILCEEMLYIYRRVVHSNNLAGQPCCLELEQG